MNTFFKTKLLTLILTVALCGTAPTAYALYDGWFDTYHIDNSVQRDHWNNYSKGYSKAKKSKGQNTQKKSLLSDRYTHSGSVTSQVNRQMIASLRQSLQANGKLTAQAERELNQLANSNLIGKVKNALKKDGYEPNRVATAMAYWVVINYGISQRADLSQLKAHAMVNQLKEALGDDMAKMSDADKQKMADTLYWYGSLQMAFYLEAVRQNNHQAINTHVSQAKSGLSKMGLSVNNIKNNGNHLSLQ